MKCNYASDGDIDVCLGRQSGHIDSWFLTFTTHNNRKVYFKYTGNEQSWNFNNEITNQELVALLLEYEQITIYEATAILAQRTIDGILT